MGEYNCVRDNENAISTLDANRSYWQFELNQKNMDRTVILKHGRMHRCMRLSFSSKNVHPTFQEAKAIVPEPTE